MTDRAMSDDSKPCVIWECIYDHGNGKFMGDASKAQRQRAFDELHRLHAEVEALREDAERYRWLREHGRIGFSGAPHWNVSISFDSVDSDLQTLDKNIDAARKISR